MHDDLFQFLTNNPAITAIFGARIFHEFLPQSNDTYPALTFQLASSNDTAEDMEDNDAQRLVEDRWQMDVIARKSADVINAAKQFDSIFRIFRGTMGAVAVQHIERANESHLGDVTGDKQNRRVSLDYSITFAMN